MVGLWEEGGGGLGESRRLVLIDVDRAEEIDLNAVCVGVDGSVKKGREEEGLGTAEVTRHVVTRRVAVFSLFNVKIGRDPPKL